MAASEHAPNDRDLKPSARKNDRNERKKDDVGKGDAVNPLAPPINVGPGS